MTAPEDQLDPTGRRGFLALAAAGAGTLALAACSSSGSGSDGGASKDDPGDTTSTTAGRPTTTTEPATPPDAQGVASDPFTIGVSSGDPLPDSVILWTRLAPKPTDASARFGMPDADVDVLWEVARDDGFDDVVASGLESAKAEFGHSVHVDAKGLEPDSWYHYRFRIGSFTSAVGRTRTMPEDTAKVRKLTLAFVSCQDRKDGLWNAYEHLAEDELDLIFHLGDYVYESPGGSGPTKTFLDHEPTNLDDYRVLYADYKSDPLLQKAHLVAPWVVTWDDHEVENDYAGLVPQNPQDEDAFPERRKAAYQAFWEHHPVRIDPPAADGGLTVYRTLRFGALATFFVLDGRQYRTDQVCDNAPTTAEACPALADETHTMLGTEQEAWLTKGLGDVDTGWTVLAQQTVMKALVLGDTILNPDQWDGYPAARTRLLQSIDDAGLENVMVLTGDIHAAGAANLRLPTGKGKDPAQIKGKIVAHELVGTSISSTGLGAVVGGLDLSGIGIPYANFSDHGYARCTITPGRWLTEFVVVDTVTQPESTARIDAKVEVKAGKRGVKVL